MARYNRGYDRGPGYRGERPLSPAVGRGYDRGFRYDRGYGARRGYDADVWNPGLGYDHNYRGAGFRGPRGRGLPQGREEGPRRRGYERDYIPWLPWLPR